jgi:hypothetical protein
MSGCNEQWRDYDQKGDVLGPFKDVCAGTISPLPTL